MGAMVEVTTFPLQRCMLLESLSKFPCRVGHDGIPIHHLVDGAGDHRRRCTITRREDTDGDDEQACVTGMHLTAWGVCECASYGLGNIHTALAHSTSGATGVLHTSRVIA